MAITEDEFKEIIKEPNADIEKISILSSDGKNLLTRIPKEITDYLKLNKGDKIKWLVDAKTKEVKIEMIKDENKTI
jgi:hypothetical protein